MASLNGLVAFVSGGASGLGKATLIHLLKKGARACYAFDKQALSLDQDYGTQVGSAIGDIRSEDDVKQALDDCVSKFGKIDAIINCAGVGIAFRVFNFNRNAPHALKDFKDVIEINTVGTFNVTRLAVKHLCANSPDSVNNLRGVIINTSSCASTDGMSGQCAYAASVGAINSMTLPIARDLSSHGIRCVTVSVGYFLTPSLASIPQDVRDYIGQCCISPNQIGDPKDYAMLIESIILNSYINGNVIKLDAGFKNYYI